MLKQDITKFEFLLTLEKNIIIQRFFNVTDYNTDSKNSMDLYYAVTDICDEISEDLKIKNFNFMCENTNYFFDLENSGEEENKPEYFKLQIKLGEEVFITRIFSAHIYHPNARYSVDIRPKVRRLLNRVSDVLSSKSLETNYLQYQLAE